MSGGTSKERAGRRLIFARGMTADCVCEHVGWLDELQRRAELHDELLAALQATVAVEMYLPDHPQRQAAYDTARAAIAKWVHS